MTKPVNITHLQMFEIITQLARSDDRGVTFRVENNAPITLIVEKITLGDAHD